MKNKKGFTLVEIMIVVVIIGLLAAMAVPAFQQVRGAANDKSALNDLRQIASGADQYFLEYAATSVNTTSILELYVKSLNQRFTFDEVIYDTMTEIVATLPDGETIQYQMRDN